MDIVDLSQECC